MPTSRLVPLPSPILPHVVALELSVFIGVTAAEAFCSSHKLSQFCFVGTSASQCLIAQVRDEGVGLIVQLVEQLSARLAARNVSGDQPQQPFAQLAERIGTQVVSIGTG